MRLSTPRQEAYQARPLFLFCLALTGKKDASASSKEPNSEFPIARQLKKFLKTNPVNATYYAFYAFGSNARTNLASLHSRDFAVLCSKESATLSSSNQTFDSSSALEDFILGRCVDAAIGPRAATGHFQRETPSSSRKPSHRHKRIRDDESFSNVAGRVSTRQLNDLLTTNRAHTKSST
jgi:hypothetical protein